MSLALDPSLVVMDEPTTGLDVLVQERIIRKVRELRASLHTPILLITHDISVIAEMSDRIAIMYAGQIMELASTIDLFEQPVHPYTLLKMPFPASGSWAGRSFRYRVLRPACWVASGGCPFRARCPFAVEPCAVERPPCAKSRQGMPWPVTARRKPGCSGQLASEKATWQSSVYPRPDPSFL
ncbi:MAG: hypothetical protein R3D03_07785 [Geminicoccaceae bacterium]